MIDLNGSDVNSSTWSLKTVKLTIWDNFMSFMNGENSEGKIQ